MTIAIQAGGESTRMGSDKGLVSFLGEPLITRLVRRLSGWGEEILITTNEPSRYESVDARPVVDVIPGMGALGGLYTALSAARYPLVAVVACDMPFANPQLLTALRAALIVHEVDAAVPLTANGYEPLHAVYRREDCLPAVHKALERGQRRMIAWFADVRVYNFTEESIRQVDPTQTAFLNVNTPVELRQAEQIAQTTST